MIRPENMSRTLALLALFCLLPGLAFANAGKILFAQGEVVVVDADGERAPVDTGHELEEGDRIKTGAEARTQIRLSDGALISLRRNSDYQIVAQKTEEGLMKQAGKLFSGWMRTVTGTIGEENPDAVEQETPVATIGIRGTTYQVIHMPEGGLPGVPESEPGTYIYLQQGRIESTAGGESRFMEPGDVVFVPVEGGAPVPTPNKKSLFSGNEGKDADSDEGDLLETPGADNDGDEDRDNLESTDALNDGLNQQLGTTTSLPGGGALGSFIVDGSPFFLQSPGEDVLVQNPLLRMASTITSEGPEVRYEAQVNDSATPAKTGSHGLGPNDTLAWGIWRSGDYSLTARQEDGTTMSAPNPADWHYIYADNAFTSAAEVIDLGLTGQATYDYVGGTGLTSASGDAVRIDSGSIQVNFDDLGGNQALQVVLALTANQGAYQHDYTGDGSLNAFYNPPQGESGTAGLTLTRGDESGNGIIYGQFSGKQADAIISGLNLEDGDFGWINGTAAFASSQPPETGSSATLTAPGAVGAYWSQEFGRVPFASGQSAFSSENNYITSMSYSDIDNVTHTLSETVGEPPTNRNSTTLSSGDRVDWGVWGNTQYSVSTSDGTSDTPNGEWLYMYADNVIPTMNALTNMGLTGTFQYDYVGGQLSGGSEAITQTSTLTVHFDSMNMDVNLDTQNIGTFSTSASQPISDFYQDGIALQGGIDGGTIQGRFIGENADGVISSVTLLGNTNHHGTAAFERGAEVTP